MPIFDRQLREQIERLKREVREKDRQLCASQQETAQWKKLAQTLGGTAEVILGQLQIIERQNATLSQAQERNQAAVMADLQTLSDALDAQGQTIQAEAQEVKTKLDEQTALIEQLRQNANDPAKIQELADKIETNNGQVRAIFTGEPAPAPASRRR
jgi:chromosome segregation ATPase